MSPTLDSDEAILLSPDDYTTLEFGVPGLVAHEIVGALRPDAGCQHRRAGAGVHPRVLDGVGLTEGVVCHIFSWLFRTIASFLYARWTLRRFARVSKR